MENYAIILASGTGSRFNNEIPKQFVKIGDRTILERSVCAFEENENISKIVIVITPEYKKLAEEILEKADFKKLVKIVNGGEIRKDSSYNGVMAVDEITDKEVNVLIHDCARPFVSQRIINDCVKALEKFEAVDVGAPCVDTIIEVKDNIVKKLPERKNLRRVQTPQCFRLSLIKKAHELSKNDENFTDDCGLILKHNLSDIYVVEGDVENIKITYPADFYYAQKYIEQ